MSDPSRGHDAEPEAPRDPGAIDALIPPPWSPTRRLVVTLVAVVLIVGVVFSVRSGVVGPQLEHGSSWGSSVEVVPDGTLVAERLVPIRNAGMLPVELEALELPEVAGLTWLEIAGVPTTLEPAGEVEIAIGFEVADCTIDAGGLDTFPVRAGSGIAPARVVEVGAPLSDEPEHRAAVGDHQDEAVAAVLAAWADQPASWLLDTIAAACLDPDLVGSAATDGAGR